MDAHAGSSYSTLVDLLQARASDAATRDARAFSFLGDGETLSDRLTFAQLDARARALAAHLQQHAAPGDRALLVYAPGLDYIVAFFACAYAGLIAVPALSPANARTLPRLRLIAEDATPRIALATAQVAKQIERFRTDADAALASPTWLATDALDGAPTWRAPASDSAAIAFLQYTSGSTGTPKGVMVSHANILANVAMIHATFAGRVGETIVSWLPPHHDMGLIGKILYPVFAGSHCVHLPPAAFLAKPYRWLKAISDFRARLTAAPNFAYDLCVEKIGEAQKATLDLSCLEFALNGAEPVRAATLRRFAETFAPCGLRENVVTPVYGLAEATLLVTSTRHHATDAAHTLRVDRDALASGRIDETATENGIDLVAAGPAHQHGHGVVIVDTDKARALPADRVGEIWIHGPSIAQGYWNRDALSADIFGARLAGSPHRHLRSGDLGFVHDGQLYISGRSKDMMIFSGRNLYPQDIEATVESLDAAFRANGCAAFALETTLTTLVIVQEIETRKQADLASLVPRLRAAIAEQHEVLDLAAIVLVKAGHLPRTSSGKIQRSRARAMFLGDAFAPIAQWRADETGAGIAPSTPTELRLAALWSALFGRDIASIADDFFSLGGHSLLAAQALARIRAEFGIALPLTAMFETPTIQTLAVLIDRAERTRGDAPVAIERPDRLPLSLAQQRLWLLEQLDPTTALAHMLPAALRWQGSLDTAALRRAFDRLVDRHEILRTTFALSDGEAIQRIAPIGTRFALMEVDLGTLEHAARDAAIASALGEETNMPFDLAAGPLVRARLLRLGRDEHLLVITHHHLVTDGWSIGVMLRELRALYAAFCDGSSDPLPAPTLQFADFALWQRRLLDEETTQQQLVFWKQHLADAPALLDLPLDRPRPAQRTHRGGRVAVAIPAPLVAAVRRFSRHHGATPFMTVLAAWSLLLSRLSGQSDVVVGSPVAGRSHADTESLLGFFVNTLALRIDTSADQTVAELLRQIKATTLGAYANQDVPFDWVVDALRPRRSLGHSPLFQAVLAFNNTPGTGAWNLPGLTAQPIDIAARTAQFDLSLSLDDDGEHIAGYLEYASDIFDRATIERFGSHFLTVLRSTLDQPDTRVGDITWFDERERQRVLIEFNSTALIHDAHLLLHRSVERQAAIQPESPALVSGTSSLSYGELNIQANRLAHHLIGLGIRPDSRVAIALDRRIDIVIAILAVLKAGGAYVPIDPTYPVDRLSHMLTDSAPTVLITHSSLRGRFTTDAVTLCIDSEVPIAQWQQACAENPRILDLTSSHLAYVIYTSGSTGVPKGVMVTHAGLRNLIATQARHFGVTPSSRVLQFASFSFDASVFELAMALCQGASLHFLPSEAKAGAALANALAHERVTHATLTPAVLATLPHDAKLDALQTIIVAGDVLPRALAQRWATDRRLFNAYGPTEASVWSTLNECAVDDVGEPSIGRAIDNVRVYVLDANRQPLPIGVTGELYIGGAGVARGYLHRDDLTEARFVEDPFCEGQRLYRSGDLARWRADGRLDYVGRNDFQVKIRGFRIELGEIEVCLARCEGVREATVLAREDVPGDKRIVAYIITAHGDISVTALRTMLATHLPEHMLPSAIVVLDTFPLTPNGKLDRNALPAPDRAAASTRDYEAPRGEVEIALAGIWSELLGIQRIGRHDHFFELGGHSLLVVSLIERLRQAGLASDVRAIFATPILAELASIIATRPDTASFQVPPNRLGMDTSCITPDLLPLIDLDQTEIERIVSATDGGVGNVQDIYPLAPLQQGILFHHLLETEGDAYLLRSVIAFDSRDRLDAFLAALQRVIDRHDILRTAVRWEGLSQPAQVVQRKAPLPLCEFVAVGDAHAELLARTDPRHTRLDLTRAPLLAAAITRDAASGEWLMALLSHHLVDDNTTLQLVMAEVRAILDGKADTLPPSMPYRDFIAQIGAVPAATHEAYFRSQLADIQSPTAPFDVLDTQGDAGAIVEWRGDLPTPLAARIRDQARQRGTTPAVLFHAAWAHVLAVLCGRDEVVFGTTLSGRLQGSTGADRALGMFINTLPIRLDIGNASATEVLDRTYRGLSELLSHEQAPLSLAQRCSGVAAPLPLFTSLLNYRHSALIATPEWEGIRVLLGQERTNFPLTVSIDDRGSDFGLVAQCAPRIDPERVLAYLTTALQGLVDAVANRSAAPLRHIPILPEAEREQVLHRFNATQAEYPRERLLHQFIEIQAKHNPEAIAVSCGDKTLRYRELNQRANHLAHRLIAVGIEPDARVAVCLERDLDLVVALVAILKSGGAYVPLDPAYPSDRLAYMLADSAPSALITPKERRETFEVEATYAVLCVDEGDSDSTAANDPTIPTLRDEHLAYIIYTSGSTGQPKGVAIEHRNAANLIEWALRNFDGEILRRSLFSTSINFDLAVFELFVPLAAGASVVLVDNALAPTVDITLINTVPSAIDALVGTDRVPGTVRQINLAGEPLKRALVERIFATTAADTVANLYGPSETTTYSTWIRMHRADGFDPSIGRPIANTQIYLLDPYGQPVPRGVVGELYIGGAGVARGYLHRPELTAERFVDDPFHPGQRMYKTGDLGRWRDEGRIDYLGRNDFQVKIRGFRIELGEIEARLLGCAGVADAVVTAREDMPGDKRLVAYVVAPNVNLSISGLRQELSRSLPEHMLPSAFVQLDAFPLTPNGKLDRKALPTPDRNAVQGRVYEAPQTSLENTLAGIWGNLLAVERVSRNDHFFELGGHSLLVVSLIEKLRQAGLACDVRTVFANPVLSDLARSLDGDAIATLFVAEPNRIERDTVAITPEMLPLIDLSQGEIDAIVDSVPGGVAEIQDIYPLSPLQEGILFHHLLETQGDAYLLRSVLAFDSRERLDAFLGALQQVIDRHDILRTAVRWRDLAQPLQIVLRDARLPLTEFAAISNAEAELLARTDPRQLRIDLTQAPLMAATATFDPNRQEWLLAILNHHLACDHLTVDLIVEEVMAILDGRGDMLSASLPYRNFIAQTRSVPAEAHEAYFRAQLADLHAPTAPFEVLDTKGDGEDIAEHHLVVSASLAASLRAVAKQRGMTPAVLFHAAWAKVLSVLCGRDDVVFGTTLSGRLQGSAGADRVLGMFINTLPIRMSLEGATVGEVVDQTYQRLSELLGHEQAPLALAQRCSGVAAPLPLFTSLLNYRHTQLVATPEWQGMRLLHGQERTNYPLTLSIDDRGQDFGITAQCASRIDPRRVTGYLLTALEGLVDGLARDGARPIRDVTILSAQERLQVVEQFNDTAVDYPRDRLLHQFFEEQATSKPDAVAVMFGDTSLTYDALNRRANQLAHRLIDLGIVPDTRVAICAERSLDVVVGLLAILKAGGAYVPLDPAYPADRLAYMLADSAPVALLTQSALRGQLTPPDSCTTLLLDDAATFASQPDTNLRVDALTANHVAYVIYTSGSTGQPKGVAMPQRALLNLLQWQHRSGLDEVEKTLQFAALGFDVAFQEIFSTLCSGGTLVLITETLRHDPAALVAFLRDETIERVFLPFIALQNLADAAQRANETLPALKHVVTAGEQLRIGPSIRRLFGSGRRLHNHYGPTETHVVTAHTLPEDPSTWPALPSIGTPIANTRSYILDAQRQPVPIGVPGELYLGGISVAIGYLHRPELTAERFIDDPFHPGICLYKTGDLARWTENGEIHYLGRNDFQVKIRGFRVELGEIEAQLATCVGVREAVVVAREDQPGEKRLVAYVIAQADTELSIAVLRDDLSGHLPNHMVPSALVQLDAFPLTPNGKLDRKALPAPDRSAVVVREYEAPQGPIEEALAMIWQDLLGIERVGRHDHFFELGGHSLLVIGLVERLRQNAMHAEVRNVFAAPTLSVLAALIAQQSLPGIAAVPPNRIARDCKVITPELLPLVDLAQPEIDTLVTAVPGGVANIQDIYPLAPLQEGILFHHLIETEGDAYLLRWVMAFASRERLDHCTAALQAVIDRHDILRTAVHCVGVSQPVQVVQRHARLSIEHLAPIAAADAKQHLLEYSDPRRTRIDLTHAPLLAATTLHDPHSDEWLLALHCHHIVTDHISIDRIAEEIQQLVAGTAHALPTPVPYRDFIAQTRAVPAAAHEKFFSERLHDVTEPTVPFGIVDVQGDGAGVSESTRKFDRAESFRLRACARQHGVSVAVLFHAAWAHVIGMCSGRDDVIFGTTLSGRMQGTAGADRALGLFINTLPIRIELAGRDALASVQEIYRLLSDLLQHEQAPLALAQRCSKVIAPTPLFTSLLNYRHTSTEILDTWDGMRLLSVDDRTNYPITVCVDDLGEDFALITQCVAGIDAARVSAYFATALSSLVDALTIAPETPVLELPILPTSERHALLGPDAMASATTSLIHALFEVQTALRPDATALTFGETSVSYSALNRQANQLAHRLIALGVSTDQRVAICLERGVDLVVGVMAILKAGGAYVPMDPAYPADRLAYMLADSAPVAIITQQSLLDRVYSGVPTLVLDDASTIAELSGFASYNPEVAVLPPHLAYVIYTSGSTGQPKGVMVEHGHVTRLFSATQDEFYFDDTDVWTLFHSFAFDFSVWEIFGALLHGGRLVIVPSLCARSPSDFYALLCRERVTVLNQTPSAFRTLIAAQADSTSAHSLRCIVFGGEALDLRALKPWIVRNDPQRTQLINMYGITEITVHATYRALSAADIEMGLGSVIGRPLSDLRLLILDANRQPSPIGVSGEIYIGGAGVARGYLNRDALTAERFITDPFHPGERLYKTGDLGRWRDNGDVEYLGRNDFQVKIRGFRIELGEIEAKLAMCVGVREGVVIAREDQPGDKRLVAYVIADGELSIAEVRSELSTALPEHMVPSAFVQIDAFPLTPNGKLDRNALPAPDQAAVLTRAYEPPDGEIETALATAWAALLGLERVGRHDHFFELGGHSLLVVSLIERLRQAGLSTNVRTIFAHPVLSALAQQITASDSGSTFVVPPNRIAADCTAITPELLPLIALSQSEIDTIVVATPGGVTNIQDIYPLAPLQEGILFHHLLETEGDAYLLRSVVAFDTHRRLDTFLSALQHVIDRHDILRSAVRWQGLSQPVQIVHRQAPLPVHTVVAESDAQAELLAQTDPRHTRLDLTRAPLLSATIMHDRTTGEWLMALLSHHLIDDNYTMQLVMAEVQAVIEGQLDTLPPSMPYRNFIAQIRAVPDSEHEAYFRSRLADIDAPTAPFDVLDTQGDGEDIVEHHAVVPDALVDRLRATAKQRGTTPAVLFHAAWAKVLSVLCGRDEVVFGTTLSGRLQGSAGADRVLGMFINTLPIRVSLGEASIGEIVDQTYQRLSELLGHEQAPLALAQRCSGVAAPLPLFTSLLNYRHTQLVAAPEWQGMRLLHGQERTNYPLTLSIDDRGHDFGITAQCAGRIDPQRVVGYLVTALEGLVAGLSTDDARSISEVAILSAQERLQVVERFNDTAVAYPRDRLLHQFFEDQAAAQPDAIAVVVGESSLTYDALNRRANQLAHRLIDLGIVPDTRVAICAERGLDVVVGLMAILKAGGAYVPLDPAYPADRLAYMLADSAPVALLTQGGLRGLLTPTDSCTTLLLDDTATVASQPDTNPSLDALTADHLAYVIYTSGSTGQPKGVAMPQRALRNLLQWQHRSGLDEVGKTLQFAALGFDVAFQEIFSTICSGGTLVLIDETLRHDPSALVAFLRDEAVERLFLPFIALQNLADAAQRANETLPALRHVVTAGEQLRIGPSIRRLFGSGRRLHNHYGPTETHVVTAHTLAEDPATWPALPPIGTPIANTQSYILDAQRQPVPIGVPGELYLGGVSVAAGYLHRPELTAQRFIDDPFHPGGRLYKTGDLARWTETGEIEYLGRNDFQVKIRGFRVELGEIEARLATCFGVREAVVIAREDQPGDKRLVAYVIAQPDTELAIADLRSALTSQLPDHMVPSAFVQLDAFPLTPNGKLDRKALPAPDRGAVVVRGYEVPQGPVEETLAAIWQDLLGIERVGRHDHFFELGGHSLLAVQMSVRLRDAFEVDVPLRSLFEHPQLAALAEAITTLQLALFSDEEIAAMQGELDSLSEAELLASLSGYAENE